MRGEVWTVSGGVYAGKPRPAVILQSDAFGTTASITLVPFSTNPTEAPIFRPRVHPDAENGVREPCSMMIDKITTVPRTNLGSHLGRLSDGDITQLNRAVVVFLGLA